MGSIPSVIRASWRESPSVFFNRRAAYSVPWVARSFRYLRLNQEPIFAVDFNAITRGLARSQVGMEGWGSGVMA